MTLVFIPSIASAANTADFAGGSGTEADPYLISTTAQLNNVRKYLGAHFKMMCDVEFTKADFATGGALYNGGAGWEPIGTKDSPFTGTFDGNGFAVKNLYVNISSSSADVYAGLFGYNNGTIKNLGMVDGSVSASAEDYSAYTGEIAGCNAGTIKSCYNTGKVSATASSSFYLV